MAEEIIDYSSAEQVYNASLTKVTQIVTSASVGIIAGLFKQLQEEAYNAGDSDKKLQKKFLKIVENFWGCSKKELKEYTNKFDDELETYVKDVIMANTFMNLSEKYGRNVPMFTFDSPKQADIVRTVLAKFGKETKRNAVYALLDANSSEYEDNLGELENVFGEMTEKIIVGLVPKKEITISKPKATAAAATSKKVNKHIFFDDEAVESDGSNSGSGSGEDFFDSQDSGDADAIYEELLASAKAGGNKKKKGKGKKDASISESEQTEQTDSEKESKKKKKNKQKSIVIETPAAATTTATATAGGGNDKIAYLMEKISSMSKSDPQRSKYKKKLKALLAAEDSSE